jgi:hypothetical protein
MSSAVGWKGEEEEGGGRGRRKREEDPVLRRLGCELKHARTKACHN